MDRPQRYKQGDKVIITEPDLEEYTAWYDQGDPRILWFGISEQYARKEINKIVTIHSWYCNQYGGKDTYHYSLIDEDGNRIGYVFPWWMLTPFRREPKWEV